jgi:integrase
MSIRPTRSGKWQVDYCDEWGKRQRRTVANEATARALDAQLQTKTRDTRSAIRNFQQGETLTLPDALEIYLAHVTAMEVTKRHMRQRLSQFIQDAGQTALAQVTPRLAKEWFEARATALSPQTLWRDLKMLRKWFQWLKEAQYAVANPWATLHMPKPTESRARAITYREEWEMLKNLQPRTRLRCLLALDAGLSLGEISALRRHHIDFTEGTIRVLITAKRHQPRTVPLSPRLAATLWEQCGHSHPDAPVTQRAGLELREGSANKFMRKLQLRTGLNFRFHDLRHTFASRLDAAGVSPFAIAELQGHAIPRVVIGKERKPFYVTTRDYVHPTLEQLREAIMTVAERTNRELHALAEKEK